MMYSEIFNGDYAIQVGANQAENDALVKCIIVILFLSIFSRFTQLNLSNMVTDGTQSHMLCPSKTGLWVS